MRTSAVLALGALLAGSAPAVADHDNAALSRVRLTTDPTVPVGCARIGIVRDDSIKDLRCKVLKAGGDTALLSFPTDDLEKMDAQVFRCPPHAVKPNVPPPPPGPPPPPPPR